MGMFSIQLYSNVCSNQPDTQAYGHVFHPTLFKCMQQSARHKRLWACFPSNFIQMCAAISQTHKVMGMFSIQLYSNACSNQPDTQGYGHVFHPTLFKCMQQSARHTRLWACFPSNFIQMHAAISQTHKVMGMFSIQLYSNACSNQPANKVMGMFSIQLYSNACSKQPDTQGYGHVFHPTLFKCVQQSARQTRYTLGRPT